MKSVVSFIYVIIVCVVLGFVSLL